MFLVSGTLLFIGGWMMYSGDYQNVINSREEVLIKCLVRNSRDSHLGISKAVAQRRQKAVSTV